MAGVMFTPSTYGGADLDIDTGWVDLTLLNGWLNYGGVYPNAAYRMIGGVVYIRGLIKSGTVTNITPLATLPVGCRPAFDHMSAVTASPGSAFARIDVQAGGNIVGMMGLVTGWTSITVAPFIAEQ